MQSRADIAGLQHGIKLRLSSQTCSQDSAGVWTVQREGLTVVAGSLTAGAAAGERELHIARHVAERLVVDQVERGLAAARQLVQRHARLAQAAVWQQVLLVVGNDLRHQKRLDVSEKQADGAGANGSCPSQMEDRPHSVRRASSAAEAVSSWHSESGRKLPRLHNPASVAICFTAYLDMQHQI